MLGGVQIYVYYGRQKSKEVPEASVLLEGKSEWKWGGGGKELFCLWKSMLGRRVIARDVSRYKVYQGRQGYLCKIEVEKAKQIRQRP